MLQRTTNLLDGVKDVPVSRTMFVRSILPIGLLFSGSLILSNSAYLYLSMAYIQMLKVRPLYLLNTFQHSISTHMCSASLTYKLYIGFHAGRDPSYLVA